MPLRPDPYWTDERLEKFRDKHFKDIKAIADQCGDRHAVPDFHCKCLIEDSLRSEYRRYELAKFEDKNSGRSKHPLYQEWLTQAEKHWTSDKYPLPMPFEAWLAQKHHEANFKTNILIASDCVITYEHAIAADLASINTQLLALLEKRVDLTAYQQFLGIKILKIDKPQSRKIGFIDV